MKKVIVVSMVALLGLMNSACSNSPQIAQPVKANSQMTALNQGTIVNIKQIELDIDTSTDILGSGLGMVVGELVAPEGSKEVLSTAGLFIGGDIALSQYGKVVDQLTIATQNGTNITVLVPLDQFKLHQQVRYSSVDNKISLASHQN